MWREKTADVSTRSEDFCLFFRKLSALLLFDQQLIIDKVEERIYILKRMQFEIFSLIFQLKDADKISIL